MCVKKDVNFFAFCFSCLPSDLEGAVRQSSEAAALFVTSGGMRATVCAKIACSFILYFLFSIFHTQGKAISGLRSHVL